jgi:hypothetical protein
VWLLLISKLFVSPSRSLSFVAAWTPPASVSDAISAPLPASARAARHCRVVIVLAPLTSSRLGWDALRRD